MSIERNLKKKIENDFGKRKIILVYGARQVGKTTLMKEILVSFSGEKVLYNCDLDAMRELLGKQNLEHLRSLVEKYELIIIDEAQRVPNIGLTLKILIDAFPEKQFIVTGSSSFELASAISEPLTGRCFTYTLYPLSLSELGMAKNPIEIRETLEERLIFGSYPDVVTTADRLDKQRIIEGLAEKYLFRDILAFGAVKNSDMLKKLLRAVALQVGQEVSYTELSKILEIDKGTVKRYLDICQKAFILFSLPPFTSNKRNAISSMNKYYFFDVGIRNALIRNFNSLEVRNDVGALWENFMLVERLKRNASKDFFPESFFWRSYQKQEIDLIEEANGQRSGFEFKYTKSDISKATQNAFSTDINGNNLTVVNRENFFEFVM